MGLNPRQRPRCHRKPPRVCQSMTKWISKPEGNSGRNRQRLGGNMIHERPPQLPNLSSSQKREWAAAWAVKPSRSHRSRQSHYPSELSRHKTSQSDRPGGGNPPAPCVRLM